MSKKSSPFAPKNLALYAIGALAGVAVLKFVPDSYKWELRIVFIVLFVGSWFILERPLIAKEKAEAAE